MAVSTCGMGQSFPLPVLSALELFPQDFEVAIENRGQKTEDRRQRTDNLSSDF